jgi:hypothetical protein
VRSFGERLLGAARLDPATYEEVEHDEGALGQALAVVLLSGGAGGLAALGEGGIGVLGGMVLATAGWGIWALLIYLVGTRLLPEAETRADLGQLLRTLGFAAAPGIARVLAVITPLRAVVLVATSVWMIAAMVVAVRQALDYTSTRRAIGVCVVAWLGQVVVLAAVLALLMPRAARLSMEHESEGARPPAAGSIGVVEPSAVAPPAR